jgi:hypothetical protein
VSNMDMSVILECLCFLDCKSKNPKNTVNRYHKVKAAQAIENQGFHTKELCSIELSEVQLASNGSIKSRLLKWRQTLIRLSLGQVFFFFWLI